jgi:hypothetical protein
MLPSYRRKVGESRGMIMSRIFNTLVFLAICVVVVGYFLSWFTVTSQRDEANHKLNINVSVDTLKVQEDTSLLKSKTSEFAHKVSGDAHPAAESPTSAPMPAPTTTTPPPLSAESPSVSPVPPPTTTLKPTPIPDSEKTTDSLFTAPTFTPNP